MKLSFQQKLCIAAAFSVCACGLSFLPAVSDRNAPKASSAALLNPAEKELCDEIRISRAASGGSVSGGAGISQVSGELYLKKQGSVWTAQDGTITCLADHQLISECTARFSEKRRLYTVSESYSERFFPSPVAVSFGVTGKNSFSEITIQPGQDISGRILLTVSGASTVFETEDDVSSYCTTDVAFFADGQLFPAVSTVVSASLQPSGGKRKLSRKENAGELASLRHGQLHPASDTAALPLVATVRIEADAGRVLTAFVYKADSKESAYLVRTVIEPSPSESPETKAALSSLSYAAEISEWTYSRLTALFTE
ncbi:MAG: hypothetical protein K6G80_03775 [Treponema sp.]|nr:hypothetical protein [Treponema sp.]